MVAALIVCVLALGIGYIALRRYLHSDSFREFLSGEASRAVGVTGEFAPFHWDGLAANTESFEATGEGAVTHLRADGLHTEIGFGGLRRGVWEIRESRLQRLEMTIDATRTVARVKEAVEQVSHEVAKNAPKSGWLPKDAELEGLDVEEVAVQAMLAQGPASASGLNVHVEPAAAKHSYRAEIRGGTVRMPFKILPEIRVDQLRARYQDKHVFLTDAEVQAWKQGRIKGSGEWDMRTRQFALEGKATGMACDEIFTGDWAKRITGKVSSTFSMDNSSGTPVAHGILTVHDGVLTALPVLDALAAYADTRRFRVLKLNEAQTDWRWESDRLLLTNLVLSCDGLVRLEGTIDIKRRALDGTFKLGLAPGTLSNIPGAETDVFIPGDRGLLWTSLRITGTLDDPKENLTDRLVAAAGARMFDLIPETGEKVIKFTRSVMADQPDKVVEKGVKIIEKGSDIIRNVGGVLDGIFGAADPDEKPVEKPDEHKN